MSRLPREVLIRPLITEESSILQAEQNKYTFAVHVRCFCVECSHHELHRQGSPCRSQRGTPAGLEEGDRQAR